MWSFNTFLDESSATHFFQWTPVAVQSQFLLLKLAIIVQWMHIVWLEKVIDSSNHSLDVTSTTWCSTFFYGKVIKCLLSTCRSYKNVILSSYSFNFWKARTIPKIYIWSCSECSCDLHSNDQFMSIKYPADINWAAKWHTNETQLPLEISNGNCVWYIMENRPVQNVRIHKNRRQT